MKILTYSDLHLEFKGNELYPDDSYSADLLVLAGDIMLFNEPHKLIEFLKKWSGPVIYVAGNHEYYRGQGIEEDNRNFKEFLKGVYSPTIWFLNNESVTINGIEIFGGTLWTDFNNSDKNAMLYAASGMSDFRVIPNFNPTESVRLHQQFLDKFTPWLEQTKGKKRMVITHHAPVWNPDTKFGGSPLTPAFNSLDMTQVIKDNEIDLWIYGHTHESHDEIVHGTRVVSNPRGYPMYSGSYECKDFDPRFKVELCAF